MEHLSIQPCPCPVLGHASPSLGPGRTAPVSRKLSKGVLAAFIVWLAVVVGATVQLINYSDSPGSGGSAPLSWPRDSHLARNANSPTLVMFVHPRCPCTRASLAELDRLLAQAPGQFSAEVVFVKPDGTPPDWEKSELWRKASGIPRVTAYSDNSGREARRFHAETSGQVLLYDSSGKLQFQGGITAARGHEGDNPGRSALVKILTEGALNQAQTPVFGCALFDDQCQKGALVCKP